MVLVMYNAEAIYKMVLVIMKIDAQVFLSDYNGYGVSGYEANDGFIEINVNPDPGLTQSAYNYQWEGLDYFGWWPENIGAGFYSVTITHPTISDCSEYIEFNLTQPVSINY